MRLRLVGHGAVPAARRCQPRGGFGRRAHVCRRGPCRGDAASTAPVECRGGAPSGPPVRGTGISRGGARADRLNAWGVLGSRGSCGSCGCWGRCPWLAGPRVVRVLRVLGAVRLACGPAGRAGPAGVGGGAPVLRDAGRLPGRCRNRSGASSLPAERFPPSIGASSPVAYPPHRPPFSSRDGKWLVSGRDGGAIPCVCHLSVACCVRAPAGHPDRALPSVPHPPSAPARPSAQAPPSAPATLSTSPALGTERLSTTPEN